MGFRPSKPAPPSSNPSGGGKFKLGELFGGPGANEYFGKDPGMVEDMPNGSTTDNPYNKPSLLNRIFAPQSSAAADAANAGYKIQSVLSKQEAGQQLANGLQLAEAHARHGADQAIRIQQAADAIKTKHEDEANTFAGRIAADNFPELIPQGAVTKDGSWDYKAVGSMARQIAPLMFGEQGMQNGVMGMDKLAAQNAEAISKANLLKQQNEDPRQMTTFQSGLAATTAENDLRKTKADYADTEARAEALAQGDSSYPELVSSGVLGKLRLKNASTDNQADLLKNYGDLMNKASVGEMLSKARTTLPAEATSFSNMPEANMSYSDILHGSTRIPHQTTKKVGGMEIPGPITYDYTSGKREHTPTKEELDAQAEQEQLALEQAKKNKEAEIARRKAIRGDRDNPKPVVPPVPLSKRIDNFLRGI